MFIEVFDAVRSAQEWSQRAPRHGGEYLFGPDSPKPIVFGVFGDSVGCGLGVPSVERTFAGRVASRLAPDRRVVCRISAVSGARGRGLALQRPVGDERFAALSIGTNDIIHGESLTALKRAVTEFLELLRGVERAVVLGPGDLGSAAIVPPFLKPMVRARVSACEDALREAVRRFPHARHFGPHDLERPLAPAHYAPDGFHPSETAHALIADAVLDRLTG
ncbi:MAG TPA: GDSL-type esterase/lipase family protein [Elusimicrobiota bacterium]|nr:GDSL-type esterase/lipase family protein [Elusimicrobiota bacterium]